MGLNIFHFESMSMSLYILRQLYDSVWFNEFFKIFPEKNNTHRTFYIHANKICFSLLASKTHTNKIDAPTIHPKLICIWSTTNSVESNFIPPPSSPVTIFAESFTQNMNVVIFVIQKAYMLYELGLDQRNLACEFADDFPVSQKSKDTCRHEKIILSHTLTTLAINHHQV